MHTVMSINANIYRVDGNAAPVRAQACAGLRRCQGAALGGAVGVRLPVLEIL
jgi:hypothetical protein